MRFLYDMEIIEFVKPLDDTELDDFLYGFVISWDTPEEFLATYDPSFRNIQFCVAVLREISEELQISLFDLLNKVLLRGLVESTIRSSVHNWLGDNTGKLHFDNMILTDSILSLDTEIKRIPYYVFMAHIDLTGRIFD